MNFQSSGLRIHSHIYSPFSQFTAGLGYSYKIFKIKGNREGKKKGNAGFKQKVKIRNIQTLQNIDIPAESKDSNHNEKTT